MRKATVFLKSATVLRKSRSLTYFIDASSMIQKHNSPNSKMPLLEHYRPTWPDPDFVKLELPPLPERTVPDSALKFEFTASFSKGTAEFYKHLQTSPSDIRVKMRVALKDLPISEEEVPIFLRMVGPRYNAGGQMIKLTCEKFPNRLENRKYLIFMLEELLSEAKRLNKEKDNYAGGIEEEIQEIEDDGDDFDEDDDFEDIDDIDAENDRTKEIN
jgi:hypothetical protein